MASGDIMMSEPTAEVRRDDSERLFSERFEWESRERRRTALLRSMGSKSAKECLGS